MKKASLGPSTSSPNYWYPNIVLCLKTKKLEMDFFPPPMQMTILVQDQELEAFRKVFHMAQLNMHP